MWNIPGDEALLGHEKVMPPPKIRPRLGLSVAVLYPLEALNSPTQTLFRQYWGRAQHDQVGFQGHLQMKRATVPP